MKNRRATFSCLNFKLGAYFWASEDQKPELNTGARFQIFKRARFIESQGAKKSLVPRMTFTRMHSRSSPPGNHFVSSLPTLPFFIILAPKVASVDFHQRALAQHHRGGYFVSGSSICHNSGYLRNFKIWLPMFRHTKTSLPVSNFNIKISLFYVS